VSFFQSVYKQHTNFSQVVSRQLIQGPVSAGGMSTIRFERAGDMMGYVYLSPICNGGVVGGTAQSFSTSNWSNVINYAELYIGGQLIDRQDTTFTEFIAPNLLAQTTSKRAGAPNSGSHSGFGSQSFFYPFRFWFCENFQSSLPLVALQYHDVEIRIYWSTNLGSAAQSSGDQFAPNTIINVEAYAQYVYLDTDERKMVADRPQDMLITQVQYMTPTNTKVMPIVFNHPVKFLCSTNLTSLYSFNGSSSFALTSNTNQIIMQINGTDLSDYKYECPHFTQVPTYYHVPFAVNNASSYFVLPFCLDTSKFQPTGSLNFSRLDSFRIVSQNDNITQNVYGVNYNILRIQNGMGGLMYSN
jgi:hypothetical protein